MRKAVTNSFASIVVAGAAIWLVAEAPKHRNPLDGGNGTAYGDGGNAVEAHDGKPGMPGCDGGTNPNPDGKFYIAGTDQECNPSDGDRKKATVK